MATENSLIAAFLPEKGVFCFSQNNCSKPATGNCFQFLEELSELLNLICLTKYKELSKMLSKLRSPFKYIFTNYIQLNCNDN